MQYETDDQHRISDASDDHKFFTLIPNIIFDLGLSVYAINLYCLLKRIAGETGKCWMNTNTLAKRSNMSTGKISECKQELIEHNLIDIKTKSIKATRYHEITIVNIWKMNVSNYEASSSGELAGSCGELASSPHERIKNTVNKNTKIRVTSLQNQQTPAKKNGEEMNKEDYLASLKNSLDKSLSSPQIGYAQYPERLLPVVERMERYWHFKAPQPKNGKKGQYAFWIESCNEILQGCAEFGVELLDKLHADWDGYMDTHGGCAPFAAYTPKSLVNAVLAKAAQIRSGRDVPLWQNNREKVHQTRLDV